MNKKFFTASKVQQLSALNELRDSLTERSGREPTFSEWAEAAGISESDLHDIDGEPDCP